jgi:hypothetical protein
VALEDLVGDAHQGAADGAIVHLDAAFDATFDARFAPPVRVAQRRVGARGGGISGQAGVVLQRCTFARLTGRA